MKLVYLLDDSLQVEIFFSKEDSDLNDNICVKVMESCEDNEKIFIHDESDLFLTAQQARDLSEALLAAVKESEEQYT